ncbi:MAG: hypothetical protein MR890_07070 [Akkermansia muciniphila]|nr:hypothetical protein [Akkermansia muciniphila]
MDNKDGVVYGNEAYRLTATRLEQAGTVAELVSPGELRITRDGQTRSVCFPTQAPACYPDLQSDLPLLTAMYHMALRELDENMTPEGTLLAGANWDSVWTRDIAYAAGLGAALANPKACRKSLESRVQGDIIIQDTGTGGGWPISTDRVSWAIGAHAVYRRTGEREWLDYCVDVLMATLEDDERVMPAEQPLRRGETSFIDWREQSYPEWMSMAEIGASYAFGTNVVHCICRRILAEMLREQAAAATAARRTAEARQRNELADRYSAEATTLAEAINEAFWLRSTQHYGMYRSADGMLDDRTDALATSLAVLCGIAGEHADTAMAKVPVSPFGTPVFSPYRANHPAYHNRAVWPFVEGYVLAAHTALQNADRAAHSMGALLRAAMAFGTNKENFDAVSGEPNTLLNSDRQLWSVSSMLGLFYHTLFGIQFDRRNLVISPCVPHGFAGSHRLTGLHIRNMELSIHVHGWGTEVCSMRVFINGEPSCPVIPLDTEGKVQIELELNPAEAEESAPPPTAGEDLPIPVWDNPTPQELRWHPVPGAASYIVYADGRAIATPLDCRFKLPKHSGYLRCYRVQAENKGVCSCLSAPYEVAAPGARRFLQPLRVGEEAEYRVERNQAWLDTEPYTARLDYEGVTLASGTYRLRVLYCNATASCRDGNTCALRELFVNGERVAMIPLPHNTEDCNWESYTYSAPVTLHADAGRTIFSLRYTPRCVNSHGYINQCMVRHIELIRLN